MTTITRISEARRKLEIENSGDADCRVSFGPDSKQAEYMIPARWSASSCTAF